MRLMRSLTLLAALVAASPLSAHHSAAAEYESKLTTVSGTVVKYMWTNPHVHIVLETKDAHGAPVMLQCEANGPGALVINGWGKETLKPGDKVILEGYRAKYRPDGFKVHAATLPTGAHLIME